MQEVLPIVVVAVVIVAGLVGVASVVLSRGAYDRIGQGGMTFDRAEELPAQRDEDVAQLLAASNARRAAHGRPPLDLAALEVGPDESLRAEVRALIEARNERRIARGQPPLDVEQEVERRLSGQDG